jgi:hypothetical protein
VAEASERVSDGLNKSVDNTTRTVLGANIAPQLDAFRAAADVFAPPTMLSQLAGTVDAQKLQEAAHQVFVAALPLAHKLLGELDAVLATREASLANSRQFTVSVASGVAALLIVAVLVLLLTRGRTRSRRSLAEAGVGPSANPVPDVALAALTMCAGSWRSTTSRPADHDPGRVPMLGRLGVRQRLGVLLAIPLIACVMCRGAAHRQPRRQRAARGATATRATAAREVGALVQGLQQERLLALALPDRRHSLDPQRVPAPGTDEHRTTRHEPASDPATAAALQSRRRLALRAGGRAGAGWALAVMDPREAYSAYRARPINALLTALRLPNPEGRDSVALARQLAGPRVAHVRHRGGEHVRRLLLARSRGTPSIARFSAHDGSTRATAAQPRGSGARDTGHRRTMVEHGGQGKEAARDRRARQHGLPAGHPEQTPGQVGERLHRGPCRTPVCAGSPRTRSPARSPTDAQASGRARRRAGGGRDRRWRSAACCSRSWPICFGVLVSRVHLPRRCGRLTGAAIVVRNMSRNELDGGRLGGPRPDPTQLAAVGHRRQRRDRALASALNRVAGDAALLLERQVTHRRNVAVMFANIARPRRTWSDASWRSSRTWRSTRPPATRWRGSTGSTTWRPGSSAGADSLLVVSGNYDRERVRQADAADGRAAAVARRDRGLPVDRDRRDARHRGLRRASCPTCGCCSPKLLENAASFSPPGNAVEVIRDR